MARKILLFPPVRLIVALLFVLIPSVIVQGVSQTWLGALAELPGAVVGLAAYAGYVALVERRPVQELSLPGIGREVAQGFGLGAGLIALSLGTLAALGCATVRYVGHGGSAGYWLAAFLGVAIFEELLIRGILYRILEEWLGSYAATALSGVFFGVSHLANPNATWLGAIGIALTAGLVLAASYSLTRRLWLAVGLHWGWNFVLGGFFGGIVSGTDTAEGIFHTALHGPEWLSGGKFGLEASVVPVVLCGLLTAWMVVKIRREGRVIPPFWLRRFGAASDGGPRAAG